MAGTEEVVVGRMKLGSQGLEVSRQGLGCMGMSAFYGPPKPEPDMITLIHHAISSDVYGPFTNEVLLGKHFPRFHPENLEENAIIFEHVSAMAKRKGCTPCTTCFGLGASSRE